MTVKQMLLLLFAVGVKKSAYPVTQQWMIGIHSLPVFIG